ncbi:MAG: SDR family NAD(P)-dependent oxidoreductase [Cryomorphaceae bacterium]|nr:SDR family NAD(P)-dependent oxidoreductase [Cryomorphaceae bacterium]
MSKTIVITGASSGIGLSTAKLLAENNYHVALLSRNLEPLRNLEASFDNVKAYACDVTNDSQVSDVFTSVIAHFGGIDVLVNNAGLGIFDPLAEARLSDWHHMIDVNVKGLLSCVHAALPHLRARKGNLINIGSVASHHVFANSGVYCASKHAVLAISEALRVELSSEIKVSTVSPGSVNTAFIHQTKNEQLLESYVPSFESGLSPEIIAQQIKTIIELPKEAVISEIIIRPNKATL